MELQPDAVLPALSPAEYERLRDSIGDLGVQVPLLITPDRVLIDGHERYKAVRELGIAKFPVRIVGNLTKPERKELAIRINLERRHLSVVQRRELAAMLLRGDPRQSDRRVAATVRCDHKTVGKLRDRLVAGGEIPNLDATTGRDGKRYRYPAASAETPHEARESAKLLSDLGGDAPEGGSSLRKLRRLGSEKQRQAILRGAPVSLPSDFAIHHGDFREVGSRIKTGSVALAVCDPPWLQQYEHLREPFAGEVFRILRPGGFLCCYPGHFHLQDFMGVLGGSGLLYRWMVACVNDDLAGSIRSNGSILSCWRPVLLYQKPGAKFKTPFLLQDLQFTKKREKNLHLWQSPIEECVAFVKALSKPGDLIADLFVSSGTVPTATALIGGRRFAGTEIDGDLVSMARRRVHEALRARATLASTWSRHAPRALRRRGRSRDRRAEVVDGVAAHLASRSWVGRRRTRQHSSRPSSIEPRSVVS